MASRFATLSLTISTCCAVLVAAQTAVHCHRFGACDSLQTAPAALLLLLALVQQLWCRLQPRSFSQHRTPVVFLNRLLHASALCPLLPSPPQARAACTHPLILPATVLPPAARPLAAALLPLIASGTLQSLAHSLSNPLPFLHHFLLQALQLVLLSWHAPSVAACLSASPHSPYLMSIYSVATTVADINILALLGVHNTADHLSQQCSEALAPLVLVLFCTFYVATFLPLYAAFRMGQPPTCTCPPSDPLLQPTPGTHLHHPHCPQASGSQPASQSPGQKPGQTRTFCCRPSHHPAQQQMTGGKAAVPVAGQDASQAPEQPCKQRQSHGPADVHALHSLPGTSFPTALNKASQLPQPLTVATTPPLDARRRNSSSSSHSILSIFRYQPGLTSQSADPTGQAPTVVQGPPPATSAGPVPPPGPRNRQAQATSRACRTDAWLMPAATAAQLTDAPQLGHWARARPAATHNSQPSCELDRQAAARCGQQLERADRRHQRDQPGHAAAAPRQHAGIAGASSCRPRLGLGDRWQNVPLEEGGGGVRGLEAVQGREGEEGLVEDGTNSPAVVTARDVVMLVLLALLCWVSARVTVAPVMLHLHLRAARG